MGTRAATFRRFMAFAGTTPSDVMVRRVRNALVFIAGMAIDVDGSPKAYHPDSAKGLDRLANAKTKSGKWCGVVVDKDGEPVVQGEDDPAPGFYISPSSLVDHSKKQTDPARYVDAEVVPYIAIPPELREQGVKLGDVCMVLYRGRTCAGIVADVGPRGKYGEASVAMARALGIPSDPRRGGCSSDVTYVVFDRTTKGWPRPIADFTEQATALYAAWVAAELVA